jgi:SAM-dependent methyltransferase
MLRRQAAVALTYLTLALATLTIVLHVAVGEPVVPLPVPHGASGWTLQPAGAAYPYAPRRGQAGKDVVWIPSEQAVVDTMLDLAALTPEDTLLDLGSGDGRIVIGAARRGAHATGVEYDPALVDLSRHLAEEAGISDRARFVHGDIFETDLTDATVITMFLLPELNLRLRPALLALRPGTRIVSNTFTMDDWLPDASATVRGGCQTWCVAFLWVVPENVEGVWRLGTSRVTLKQRFQDVSGIRQNPGGGTEEVKGGLLSAARIGFRIGDSYYEGVVDGHRMQGVVESPARREPWRATRVR